MTAHDRHDEPLDPNERELARVLRALPGHEPPASLDTRILKAAQNALATPAKSRRRWLWAGGGWGLGTAAAAVLTVGVSWQLLQRPSTPPVPMPTTQVMSAPKAEEQRLSVELLERPPPIFHTQPPPDSEPASADAADRAQTQRAARTPRAEPESPRAPVVLPPPDTFSDEHVDHTAPVPAMEMPAGVAPASPPLAKSVAQEQGMRDATMATDAVQRVRSDLRLTPSAWLRRVQKRIDEGDLDGARASLTLFRERHPEQRIPPALLERLRE